MLKLYYQPKGYWVGDIMPYGKEGTFYLYDQRDDRREGPITAPWGWSLASTRDFVHYTDHGDSIERGSDDSVDQFIYAGSVFEAEGKVHAYYTGHNRIWEHEGKTSQVLLHAYSDDFEHWVKSDALSALTPQPGYDHGDWRDPWVIWNDEEQQYLLILGARLEGPKTRQTGCVVYFTSPDLKQWQFGGDFWAPNRFTMIEMPDIFKMGEWWYLVYTEYSEQSKTRYVMSRSLKGPWLTPADDAFDGRAYYAARTAFDGMRRVLFGWVPSREDEHDSRPFQWGGAYVPHELYQRDDGSLAAKAVDSLWQAFALPAKVADVVLTSPHGRAEQIVLDDTASTFAFEADITFAQGTRDFSLRLKKNTDTDVAYEYLFSLAERQLSFDINPDYPWGRMLAKGLQRPLDIVAGQVYRLRVIVDDSIMTLYINGTALNARGYQCFGKSLAIAVCDGELSLSNIHYHSALKELPQRW